MTDDDRNPALRECVRECDELKQALIVSYRVIGAKEREIEELRWRIAHDAILRDIARLP